MGLRAYKEIEVKLADEPTFNAGEEYDWIEGYASWTAYNNDGMLYVIEFEKEALIEALKDKLNKHQKEVLKNIIKEMGKDDYITYHCY